MVMKWFRKKDRVIDLSEQYKKQQEQAEPVKEEPKEDSGGVFGFLDGSTAPIPSSASTSTSSAESPEYVDMAGPLHERRRKLAKRLMSMTEKLEDLSNQIYHLQQRLEVLEKKLDVRRFE